MHAREETQPHRAAFLRHGAGAYVISRTDVWKSGATVSNFFGGEGMDFIYLLILAGLYAVSHGLVWALSRLGKSA
jgi:hypothetical protein